MGRALDEAVMHNGLSLPVTDPHCVVVEVDVVRRRIFRGFQPVSAAVGRCREFFCETGVLTIRDPCYYWRP